MSCSSVRIVEVTDLSEIPELARLSDLCIQPDPLHAFLEKYSGNTVFDSTASKLTAAINDPNSKVFKAVKPIRSEDGQIVAELVGLSQWYVGYLVVPKVDPFALCDVGGELKGVPAGSSFVIPDVPKLEDAKADPYSEILRKSGNSYVAAIRGKKHVYLRRMMVHPEHQRQGIGQVLLQWGLDLADKQKIVTWLFSRPAARRMYENAGFKVIATTEIEVDDMDVPPGVSMLRQPQARGSNS